MTTLSISRPHRPHSSILESGRILLLLLLEINESIYFFAAPQPTFLTSAFPPADLILQKRSTKTSHHSSIIYLPPLHSLTTCHIHTTPYYLYYLLRRTHLWRGFSFFFSIISVPRLSLSLHHHIITSAISYEELEGRAGREREVEERSREVSCSCDLLSEKEMRGGGGRQEASRE